MPSIEGHLAVDLDAFAARSIEQLVGIFADIEASASSPRSSGHLLVLQRSLSPIINFLSPFSKLKERTDIRRVVWLDESHSQESLDYESLLKEFKSVVFLVDGTPPAIHAVADTLKSKVFPVTNSVSDTVSYYDLSVVITAATTKAVDLEFTNLNVRGDINLFNWDAHTPLLLACDVLSLQLPNAGLRDLYQLGSISVVESLAQSLLSLVKFSNYKLRITNEFVKGTYSKEFLSIYRTLWESHISSLSPQEKMHLEDIDETLFVDQHSFYDRQCDLVVLERGIDFVTPLLTQLTYTGLADEIFGVTLNQVEVPTDDELPDSTQQVSHAKKTVKIHLEEPNDELYQKIKDLNFALAGPYLNSYAKDLQEEFNSRHKAKDITQIKNFVSKLTDLTASQNFLKNHTLIAESIIKAIKTDVAKDDALDELEGDSGSNKDNYFEIFIQLQQDILANGLDNRGNCKAILDFLYKFEPPFNDIMRLLILTTIVKGGIREAEYRTFQKELIETYGLRCTTVLRRLKEMKLFCAREHQEFSFLPKLDSSSPAPAKDPLKSDTLGAVQLINDFRGLESYLSLMPFVEAPDLANPSDPDFAFPGFVPVYARLVHSIYDRSFMRDSSVPANSKPRWQGLTTKLATLIDGPVEDYLLVPESKRNLFSKIPAPGKGKNKPTASEYVIVVAIGGISYGELAALRFVMKNFPSKRLIVLTSGMISAADVVSQGAAH